LSQDHSTDQLKNNFTSTELVATVSVSNMTPQSLPLWHH